LNPWTHRLAKLTMSEAADRIAVPTTTAAKPCGTRAKAYSAFTAPAMCFPKVISAPVIKSPAITWFSLTTFILRSPIHYPISDDDALTATSSYPYQAFSSPDRPLVLIYQRVAANSATLAKRLTGQSADEHPSCTSEGSHHYYAYGVVKTSISGHRSAKPPQPADLKVLRDYLLHRVRVGPLVQMNLPSSMSMDDLGSSFSICIALRIPLDVHPQFDVAKRKVLPVVKRPNGPSTATSLQSPAGRLA
jgi:hypothetical protein